MDAYQQSGVFLIQFPTPVAAASNTCMGTSLLFPLSSFLPIHLPSMSQQASGLLHASIIGAHDPHETLPALPANLERKIFEMSAQFCPSSILAFMLVDWRVKAW
jgi:hypothetical protein